MHRPGRWPILAAIVLLAACSTAKPVLNVDNYALAGAHTVDQVRTTIIAAAKKRGWVVEDAGPGTLQATIDNRTHRATVSISYTAASFSIHYVDSANLDYNGATIHRNYNRWVAHLRDDIEHELAAIAVN